MTILSMIFILIVFVVHKEVDGIAVLLTASMMALSMIVDGVVIINLFW